MVFVQGIMDVCSALNFGAVIKERTPVLPRRSVLGGLSCALPSSPGGGARLGDATRSVSRGGLSVSPGAGVSSISQTLTAPAFIPGRRGLRSGVGGASTSGAFNPSVSAAARVRSVRGRGPSGLIHRTFAPPIAGNRLQRAPGLAGGFRHRPIDHRATGEGRPLQERGIKA